ncbi:hypothetical protein [Nostoc sp.]
MEIQPTPKERSPLMSAIKQAMPLAHITVYTQILKSLYGKIQADIGKV